MGSPAAMMSIVHQVQKPMSDKAPVCERTSRKSAYENESVALSSIFSIQTAASSPGLR